MNKFVKSMLLTTAATAMVVTAKAQYLTGDLVIGFTGASANDVVFDLGSGTALPTSGSLNLSSFLDSSLLGANGYNPLTGRSLGVIGANATPGSQGIWSTTAHASSAPATITSGGAFNGIRLSIDNTGNFVDGSGSPANSFVIDKTDPNSWNNNVHSAGVNTFYSNYGQGQTDSAFAGSSTILDLWFEKPADGQAPKLLGTLTLGSDYSLVFDAVPVPEPSTYGIIGGIGLLLLVMRRQIAQCQN